IGVDPPAAAAAPARQADARLSQATTASRSVTARKTGSNHGHPIVPWFGYFCRLFHSEQVVPIRSIGGETHEEAIATGGTPETRCAYSTWPECVRASFSQSCMADGARHRSDF